MGFHGPQEVAVREMTCAAPGRSHHRVYAERRAVQRTALRRASAGSQAGRSGEGELQGLAEAAISVRMRPVFRREANAT